jgi:hypothetical protein
MDRTTAVQKAVNAVAVTTQVLNDYGQASTEYAAAYATARQKVIDARQSGATDNDFRTTRPA